MNDFNGKKIGILGLGGENYALFEFIRSKGAEISICDKKSREELEEAYPNADFSNIDFQTGESYLNNLEKFDLVFRTPGLPYLDEKIQNAKKSGVVISSQTKLFFENSPSPIIGITGTKGKGTTTSLIGEILRKSQISNLKSQIYVAGNIGLAPISFLDKLGPDDIVVLELSSFQLQDLEVSPHIAVVLDIKIDHLDIHKDEKEYVEAKRNIVSHQNSDDFAVINADYLTSADFAASTLGIVHWFSRKKSVDLGAFVSQNEILLRDNEGEHQIISLDDIQLRGEHNLENICAAITASYLAGADINAIKDAIKEFKGLEHRLELVGEGNGVKYYNDSFSTTPDTTIAAIRSFSEPIILLLGGSEKNADYSELIKAIDESSVKEIIPIGLTAKRIIDKLENRNIKINPEVLSLVDAFKMIEQDAKNGDIVLLSPASASFDRFKNYKDRGNQFKNLAKELL